MDQLTEEWFNARLGKVTASKVFEIMSKTKTGYGAGRKKYLADLICQRITGKREESYTNASMKRGTDLEPVARFAYEVATGNYVTEVGLIDHQTISGFAASPDGLVGDDGLIEIKCPNTATHLDFLESGIPDGKYQWQMLCQMACAKRNWCDFVSYDDRTGAGLDIKIVRFHRDDTRIAAMEQEVSLFLDELDAKVGFFTQLRDRK